MYARSTTVDSRPESIDEGIRYIAEEVMPALQAMDGCAGMSMLVDRSSGRCIATSSWRSQEAMHASDEVVRAMRTRAAEILGGGMHVEEWEIAVMHRDHPTHDGAAARVTWMATDPAQMDRAIETFKVGVLPMAEELPGWCSASLLVDRGSGRAVVTSTYESSDSMEASRDQATQLRGRTAQEAEGTILEVAEFELALAHLHVPEMV